MSAAPSPKKGATPPAAKLPPSRAVEHSPPTADSAAEPTVSLVRRLPAPRARRMAPDTMGTLIFMAVFLLLLLQFVALVILDIL